MVFVGNSLTSNLFKAHQHSIGHSQKSQMNSLATVGDTVWIQNTCWYPVTTKVTQLNITRRNKIKKCFRQWWYRRFLLWLHLDILTEATAWHSVGPAKIFLDMKASCCSTPQTCATDAGIEQGFESCINIQKQLAVYIPIWRLECCSDFVPHQCRSWTFHKCISHHQSWLQLQSGTVCQLTSLHHHHFPHSSSSYRRQSSAVHLISVPD